MPNPQVTDRIKDAPAVALRALFAAVGQLLLAADKIRARALDQVANPEAATVPEQPASGPAPQGKPATADTSVKDHSAERRVPGSRAATTPAPATPPAVPAHGSPPAATPPPAAGTDAATPGTTAPNPAEQAGVRPTSARQRPSKPVGTAKPRGTTAPAKRPTTAKPSAAAQPPTGRPNPAPPRRQPKPPSVQPGTGETVPGTGGATLGAGGAASGEPTGVRPAAEEQPASKPTTDKPTGGGPAAGEQPGGRPPANEPTEGGPAAQEPAGGPATDEAPNTPPPAPQPQTTPFKPAPPIPNYDDLSVASLRARLRGLDAATVRSLLAYETAHAGREAVIGMYERRLIKLADSSG